MYSVGGITFYGSLATLAEIDELLRQADRMYSLLSIKIRYIVTEITDECRNYICKELDDKIELSDKLEYNIAEFKDTITFNFQYGLKRMYKVLVDLCDLNKLFIKNIIIDANLQYLGTKDLSEFIAILETIIGCQKNSVCIRFNFFDRIDNTDNYIAVLQSLMKFSDKLVIDVPVNSIYYDDASYLGLTVNGRVERNLEKMSLKEAQEQSMKILTDMLDGVDPTVQEEVKKGYENMLIDLLGRAGSVVQEYNGIDDWLTGLASKS